MIFPTSEIDLVHMCRQCFGTWTPRLCTLVRQRHLSALLINRNKHGRWTWHVTMTCYLWGSLHQWSTGSWSCRSSCTIINRRSSCRSTGKKTVKIQYITDAQELRLAQKLLLEHEHGLSPMSCLTERIITLKHNIFTIFAVWEGRKYPLQVLWVQQVLWFKQELLH